ncbi:MAG: hypothetical protein HYU74_12820 [Dechloromonas sp.]|nr:hypothetical protein [Dechloromonas sp.]
MWPTVFKVLGGSLLTLAIVWGLVLAWWQSNDYEPSTIDLVLYLGAVPLALIGGYWLLRGFIEHLKAPPPVAKPNAQSEVDDDPLSGARARTAAAERGFSLCLIDAWLNVPAGASTDDVLAALEAGKSPEPSLQLTDEAGFPVFVAEVKNVDVDGMVERLLGEAGPIRQLSDQPAMVRVLALLDDVLEKACGQVNAWLDQSPEKLALQVLCLVPADWQSSHLPALRLWLGNYWPGFDPARLEIALLPVASEVDALRQVDEAILRANREVSTNELFLIVGATSAVNEQTVDNWAAGQRLFTAKHQHGRVPGEGAVALLLASQPLVQRPELSAATVISRVSHGQRDKRVDAGGRIGGHLIERLIEGLLDVTALDSTKITAAVSDADHRSGQITEMLEGLGQVFAHLDPIKDCLAIGRVNGSLAPIGSLIALACARARVLADDAPILCLSNQHDLERAVLLAMPIVAQAPIEPSTT